MSQTEKRPKRSFSGLPFYLVLIVILIVASYFFLNSMITISAGAFLCTYDNQPLSILITSYEKNSNYEMQSVISLIILALNILARVIFTAISNGLKKAESKEAEGSHRG